MGGVGGRFFRNQDWSEISCILSKATISKRVPTGNLTLFVKTGSLAHINDIKNNRHLVAPPPPQSMSERKGDLTKSCDVNITHPVLLSLHRTTRPQYLWGKYSQRWGLSGEMPWCTAIWHFIFSTGECRHWASTFYSSKTFTANVGSSIFSKCWQS